ncbi:hypothetical protein BaRGS_00030642 [Batillaria attramentaria]|uniref:Uncharacterized protein n=1 Tax=Batillaria attramentaria TaxID=370345 RepID=A0ABD0JT57_9CAEN
MAEGRGDRTRVPRGRGARPDVGTLPLHSAGRYSALMVVVAAVVGMVWWLAVACACRPLMETHTLTLGGGDGKGGVMVGIRVMTDGGL